MDNIDINIFENFFTSNIVKKLSSDSVVNTPANKLNINYIDEENKNIENKTQELNNIRKREKRKKKCEKKFKFNPNIMNIPKIKKMSKKKKKCFQCEIESCKKEYTNLSRLKIHLRTHSGLKPYTCNSCDKGFNEKGNLEIHMRIHTGEKPYKCTFENCTKEFKAYGHLSDHLRRHYGIKPFQCSICNSNFCRRTTLKTHLLIHTGEKPFACFYPGCTKKFTEKGNMKTHYKTHLKKEKPFTDDYEMLKSSSVLFDHKLDSFLQIERCESFSLLGNKTNKKFSTKKSKTNSIVAKKFGNGNDTLYYPQYYQMNGRADYSGLNFVVTIPFPLTLSKDLH